MSSALTTNPEADKRIAEFKQQVYLKLLPKLENCVPSHVQPNQLVRTLFATLEANPAIALKCTAQSLGRCLMQAATYGLEIATSGQLGHAYIVPYGDTAQLQLSYKGIKELVRRSREGIVVMGHVREGDHFVLPASKLSDVEHREAADQHRHTKPVIYAYAVMGFHNGTKVNVVWSAEKCKSHRDQFSKAWRRSKKTAEELWHEDNPSFGKMCAKSCVHALANDGDLPLSGELRELLRDKEASPPSPVIDAVPGQQAALPAAEAPPQMDWSWFDSALGGIHTTKALDDFRWEQIRAFPHCKQEIWDRCGIHEQMIQEGGNDE